MTFIPRIARDHAAALGATITRAERMSPAFIKYHLDNGQVLHRFTREEPHADPHDHPWAFETRILAGGYVEEVFTIAADGLWRSELVHRHPGETHQVGAEHIHRIVGLPAGECWTVVRSGPPERDTRFWRFGDHKHSRRWNERRWHRHNGAAA